MQTKFLSASINYRAMHVTNCMYDIKCLLQNEKII